MAECQCNISNGMLSPGVFNIKQFLNETEEMRWTVSNRFLTGGVDLADCDAFLVLQRGNGEPDEVMLTKTVNDDQTITLIWNIGIYASWLTGYVKYQIVFRGANITELDVLCADDKKAHGVYALDDSLKEGNFRTWTNKVYDNYQINYNAEFFRWQLTKDGEAIAYQSFPASEPCNGQWSNIHVGNATACAWRSLEAVMYISESIPADQSISAKYATILRQMYLSMKDMIVKSGVSTIEGTVTADDWQGDSAPYYIDAVTITGEKILNGCLIVGTRVLEETADGGYSDVLNVKTEQDQYGAIRVYSPEKVNCKVAFMVKAGNGYAFIKEDALGNLLEFTNSAVTSVNGKTGAVVLKAADFGVYSKEDVDRLISKAINALVFDTDYTAWEVYAHHGEIPAGNCEALGGTVIKAISGSVVENFYIRSEQLKAEQDVIVDWGDGTLERLANYAGMPEGSAGDWRYKMRHVYKEDGKYTIKIHGKAYFGIMHTETQSNLMCRVFTIDFPIASCLTDYSGFCCNAQRLLSTGFAIPARLKNSSSANGIFSGCDNLIANISDLLPERFCNKVLIPYKWFAGCGGLTWNTAVADVLWGDTAIDWQLPETAEEKPFYGCSDAIRANVPASWGGTASDSIIPKKPEKRLTDLENRVKALEKTVGDAAALLAGV